MNQAPVGPENGADRAAWSRENPILSPRPEKGFREIESLSFIAKKHQRKTGFEEAEMNQAPVGPENGAKLKALPLENTVYCVMK